MAQLTQLEVEMAFDESFGVENIWITEEYFYTLNAQSRTDFLATLAFHCDLEMDNLDLETFSQFGSSRRKQIRETMNQRSLCHHCQKLVPMSEIIVCGKVSRKGAHKKVGPLSDLRRSAPHRRPWRRASCATTFASSG